MDVYSFFIWYSEKKKWLKNDLKQEYLTVEINTDIFTKTQWLENKIIQN